MPTKIDIHNPPTGSSIDAIPFTARLNAYYRAKESELESPLIIDSLAARLAGDMSKYFEEHKRFTEMGGSQIARSHYIETELLDSWCDSHKTSQIILLGAGLDTRVYRLSSLQNNTHRVFELDLPIIVQYKAEMLKDERPLCELVRISTDLSKSEWIPDLKKTGFNVEIPSFWILEGLVYYIEKDAVRNLLKVLSELSTSKSELFVDVCVPTLADLRWGPFTNHFKWGVSKEDIPSFFASLGWRVTSSFLDDYSYGKDVGQKGIILVHGIPDDSGIQDLSEIPKASIPFVENISKFSTNLLDRIIPDIEDVIETYSTDPQQGLSKYLEFIKRTKADIQIIAEFRKNTALLGMISPRLFGDPLSIEKDRSTRSDDEIESYLVGYLTAILLLVYCGIMSLEGDQFRETDLNTRLHKTESKKGLSSLQLTLELIKREVHPETQY